MNKISSDESIFYPTRKVYIFTKGYELAMMGINMAIGQQLYGWNAGLSAGFGNWIIAQVLMGGAYILFIMCLSEITSTVAFEGGSYGLARMVVGFFPGCIVGFIELFEYIMLTSASMSFIGSILTRDVFNCDPKYQLLIWLIFFLAAFSVSRSPPMTRVFNIIFIILTAIVILMYCLGSLAFVSFDRNAPLRDGDNSLSNEVSLWFVGGGIGFMHTMAYTMYAYVGCEAITLLASETQEPRQIMFEGLIWSALVLFVSNIFIVFIACSLPDGLASTKSLDVVVSVGFSLMFKSSVATSVLVLPSQLAMVWSVIIPIGKLMFSMSQSKIIPQISLAAGENSHVPYMATGCVICYLICVLTLFFPTFTSQDTMNICILCASTTYLVQLIAYYKLRTTFILIDREFWTILGIPGAVIAGLIFVLLFIGTAFFQNDGFISFYSYLVLLTSISIYYYTYVKHRELLSPNEMSETFTLEELRAPRVDFHKSRSGDKVMEVLEVVREVSEEKLS